MTTRENPSNPSSPPKNNNLSPPKLPFGQNSPAVANAPSPSGPALFDRLRPRGAASGGASLRQVTDERHDQERLQHKVREVQVRAQQEVINLRQSLAAAQLDAQEQRRQFTALRDQVVRDEKLVLRAAAHEAADLFGLVRMGTWRG